jgi:hypothetical protein
MANRVTIMIDADLDKKVRIKQAELIKKSQSSVSFSKVVNEVLRGKIKL